LNPTRRRRQQLFCWFASPGVAFACVVVPAPQYMNN
jgi:hypothetical protein